MTPTEYAVHVQRERRAGLAAVGEQLDDLCRTYGLDPEETWRAPRRREKSLAGVFDRLARSAAQIGQLLGQRRLTRYNVTPAGGPR